MTKIDRVAVYNKYNCRCGYCGIPLRIQEMQVDHIIPQSDYANRIKRTFQLPSFLTNLNENDVNNPANLMPSCRVCNNWKSSHSLEFFRAELAEQLKRLNNYSSNYRIAKKFGQIEETPKPIIFYFENCNLI